MLKFAYLLFFITLIAPAPGLAQLQPEYPDLRLIEMPYRNSLGEKGVTLFRYDRYGKLRSAVWQMLDNSRHSINYHLYDDQGRETEKYREFSDKLTSSEHYFYDERGRRCKETYKRSDGPAGTGEFSWDNQGRLVATQCKKYKGWLTCEITYQYDGKLKTGAKIDQAGAPAGTIAYTHDKAGHLTQEHWDFNDQWSQTFDYKYEPIPKKVYGFSSPFVAMNPHFRVKAEDYDFNNGEGSGPSHYTYDDEGKLTKKTYEMTDGLKTVTTYAYQDNGDLRTSHRRYSTGMTADFTYTFDEAGRLLERRCKRSDGAEGFERYHWDRLGRLEKAVYNNMDFWLNGTITFRHDSWGRLVSGTFKGKDGFDAELSFETDSHANVLKMHWKFSFGKTQTYTSEYMPR